MNRLVILILILLGFTSCTEPFDFGDGDWILRGNNSSNGNQELYFRVEGDTMKIICPGSNHYSTHLMNFASDSLTLPNPCVTNRVAYAVDGDQLRLDSNYSILPLNGITSIDLFRNRDLKIELEAVDERPGDDQTDAQIYIGKRISSDDFEWRGFFGDEYMLMVNDSYLDSSLVSGWAERLLSTFESPVRIGLYIDTSFESSRTDELVEYFTKAFNGEVEFYEGQFSPKSEFFIQMKKRNFDARP